MSTKELESKIAELEKRVEEIEGNTVIIVEAHKDAMMQLVKQIIPNIKKTMDMMRKEYIETFENLDGYLIANTGVLWRLPGTSWPRFDDEGNELQRVPVTMFIWSARGVDEIFLDPFPFVGYNAEYVMACPNPWQDVMCEDRLLSHVARYLS